MLLGLSLVAAVGSLTSGSLIEKIVPRAVVGNHAIDGAPVGKSTEVAVVDEDIGLQLSAEMLVVPYRLLGIVLVDSVKLNTTLAAPVDSLVQQFALTHRP